MINSTFAGRQARQTRTPFPVGMMLAGGAGGAGRPGAGGNFPTIVGQQGGQQQGGAGGVMASLAMLAPLIAQGGKALFPGGGGGAGVAGYFDDPTRLASDLGRRMADADFLSSYVPGSFSMPSASSFTPGISALEAPSFANNFGGAPYTGGSSGGGLLSAFGFGGA